MGLFGGYKGTHRKGGKHRASSTRLSYLTVNPKPKPTRVPKVPARSRFSGGSAKNGLAMANLLRYNPKWMKF